MKQIIENLMKHTCHAELVSASQFVILSGAKNLNLPLTLTLSLKGRGKSASSAIPTSKSTKSSPIFIGRATCVKHIPASFKSLPIFINRATCVAHDKNLSTYRLNVLKTDKTPTLSRICKFAYSSLTNSTLSQRERVKYGFTLAEVFSPCRKVKLNFGFTLAEVLITLGIIGVVAALTIPILVQKYQKHITVNRLKKEYSILNNVILKASNEHGDTSSWEYTNDAELEQWIRTYILPYVSEAKLYDCSHYNVNTSPCKPVMAKLGFKNEDNNLMAPAFMLKSPNTIWGFHRFGYWNETRIYVYINDKKRINSYHGRFAIKGRDVFTFVFDSAEKSPRIRTFATCPIDNKGNRTHICAREYLTGEISYRGGGCIDSNVAGPDYLTPGDYCAALIEHDGWKISDDYPWRN